MELKLLAVHTDRWTVGPLAGQTNNNYLNAQHGGAVLRENTVSQRRRRHLLRQNSCRRWKTHGANVPCWTCWPLDRWAADWSDGRNY